MAAGGDQAGHHVGLGNFEALGLRCRGRIGVTEQEARDPIGKGGLADALRPGDQEGVVKATGRPCVDDAPLGPLMAVEHGPPPRMDDGFPRVVRFVGHVR
jgi:hypothetical protein